LEGAHKRLNGYKETQSTIKLVPHLVGLGPENTFADPPDERKEARRRQKGGYKRNAKGKNKCTIQTQNRVYEGHSRLQDGRDWQSTMPLLQHRSISRPHTVGIQRKLDQRTNMDLIKDQWINGTKVMEKMIDYAKEIGLFNEI
jgi:hypothetical protein